MWALLVAAMSHYVRMNYIHFPLFLETLEVAFQEGIVTWSVAVIIVNISNICP